MVTPQPAPEVTGARQRPDRQVPTGPDSPDSPDLLTGSTARQPELKKYDSPRPLSALSGAVETETSFSECCFSHIHYKVDALALTKVIYVRPPQTLGVKANVPSRWDSPDHTAHISA